MTGRGGCMLARVRPHGPAELRLGHQDQHTRPPQTARRVGHGRQAQTRLESGAQAQPADSLPPARLLLSRLSPEAAGRSQNESSSYGRSGTRLASPCSVASSVSGSCTRVSRSGATSRLPSPYIPTRRRSVAVGRPRRIPLRLTCRRYPHAHHVEGTKHKGSK